MSPYQGDEDHKIKAKQEESKEGIVLKVYMHCKGCENTVLRCLQGFNGVEEIMIDRANNKVIVRGKNADPEKIFRRIRKKYSTNIELLSPKPKPVEVFQHKKEPEKKEPQPQVKVVIFKMYMHCQGCVHDIKRNIVRMEGVLSVEADMGKSEVKVKGVFDPPKLGEKITRRLGKYVEIVKQEEEEAKKENSYNNKEDKEENMIYYPPQCPWNWNNNNNVYSCQIFNDENVHSCLIM
ncbi:hypothetical protein Pint_23762 [Pistacia integerrima]|uniref:Uncharacterized protein n=1 Tax=Pistacia integerrima TaxID=434235 RepID=A0ACC0YIG5_9ROSI|nr:hypothetical protein Pint_23762 [Pistacia integerrima]